jgi:hypothetical protein
MSYKGLLGNEKVPVKRTGRYKDFKEGINLVSSRNREVWLEPSQKEEDDTQKNSDLGSCRPWNELGFY